jgi:hypothetical protein
VDEARLELTARVIEAAMHTTREDKIRALGRVLADGLRDGDVDEARLLAAALALLEGPHVAVLAHLNAHPAPPAELIRPGVESSTGWRPDLLAQQLPQVSGVITAVLAVLAGQGLIVDARGTTWEDWDGRSVWQIAPLGRRCLFLLNDVSDEQGRQQ